jgi:lipopolysaccharide export LptBFGC system permease protein LptF
MEFKEIFVVIGYVVMFLMVLLLSIYNALRFKSIASRFLLLTILCLFFSDVLIALNKYYSKNDILIYIACLIEIPVYYFLLKYLLYREK